jgi:cobalt-zinc-cadmium efflux system protein
MHAQDGAAARRPLLWALAINATFLVVEAFTGWLTGSLVLLADAGHMATDVAALVFALGAAWLATRPATASKTFGYHRFEILAALLNGVLLFGVSGFVVVEAARRFAAPSDVAGGPVIIVATLGLVANLAAAAILWRGAGRGLNARAALLDMAGDTLASGGAVIAGVVMLTTGWRYADPLFAVAVGLLILPRTWLLIREAVDVLLEATPKGLALADVEAAITSVDDVESVHDLHVWTVTSGFVALSGHVTVDEAADRDCALTAIQRCLHERFEIDHVMLQVETPQLEEALGQRCFPGATAHPPTAAPRR